MLLLEKIQAAIGYDTVGSIALFPQLFVSSLHTASKIFIGNLVSWADHLMTYVNRLMDHRGRILYSAEREEVESVVLVFFVLSSFLFWMQNNYAPWSGEQPFDIWAMNSHLFVLTTDPWQSVGLNL